MGWLANETLRELRGGRLGRFGRFIYGGPCTLMSESANRYPPPGMLRPALDAPCSKADAPLPLGRSPSSDVAVRSNRERSRALSVAELPNEVGRASA